VQLLETVKDAWDVALAKPGGIVLIVACALALRWLAKRTIHRIVRSSMLHIGKTGELLTRSREERVRRDQRAHAMAGLVTSITTFLIGAVAFVMVLDVFGINIAPLLTGAGIVGVMLAFGAQTIIKDFISGAYLVLEDQIGVGDEVTMGDTSGTVELIGLRVTRLRGDDGAVWYIRNGEVVRVGNRSQGKEAGA
jgi:small-conductance mechanosensitive channel